jgi:hypothetical protein
MELSRTSTRLVFLATTNLAFGMYNIMTLQNWPNIVLPVINFLIILFAFAAIENEIEEKEMQKEGSVLEHV